MNLGWKMAAVARSAAPPRLLDSYEQERARVGRAVIDDTLAQTAIVAAPGREGHALRTMLSDALAASRELNARLAVAASGVNVAYPPTPGDNPLAGRRVPNLKLGDGPDVFRLLRAGRFGITGVPPDALADNLGSEVVEAVSVNPAGFTGARPPWDTLGATLIRPDGHLAWAADQTSSPEARAAGAATALLRWLPGIASAQHGPGTASRM